MEIVWIIMTIVVIIIIIVIIILLLVLFNSPKMNTVQEKKLHKFSQLESQFKTGDIILFSCKKYKNLLNKFTYYCRTTLLGSEYGHAGLVLKYKGKLYIVECTDWDHLGYEDTLHLNNKRKGGIRIIEMEKLLRKYYQENSGYFGVKFISQEISPEIFIDNLEKYRDVVFEKKYMLVYLAFIDIFVSHQLAETLINVYSDKEKMMCTEFVHRMLNENGALDAYTSKIFWPQKINDNDFKNLELVKFSETYRFVVDEQEEFKNLSGEISNTGIY